MSTCKAFYVKSIIAGEKKALLTLKWLEMNAFIAEALQFNNEVTLEIKQYETTQEQFKIDLAQLTNGTWGNSGYTDKRGMEITDKH